MAGRFCVSGLSSGEHFDARAQELVGLLERPTRVERAFEELTESADDLHRHRSVQLVVLDLHGFVEELRDPDSCQRTAVLLGRLGVRPKVRAHGGDPSAEGVGSQSLTACLNAVERSGVVVHREVRQGAQELAAHQQDVLGVGTGKTQLLQPDGHALDLVLSLAERLPRRSAVILPAALQESDHEIQPISQHRDDAVAPPSVAHQPLPAALAVGADPVDVVVAALDVAVGLPKVTVGAILVKRRRARQLPQQEQLLACGHLGLVARAGEQTLHLLQVGLDQRACRADVCQVGPQCFHGADQRHEPGRLADGVGNAVVEQAFVIPAADGVVDAPSKDVVVAVAAPHQHRSDLAVVGVVARRPVEEAAVGEHVDAGTGDADERAVQGVSFADRQGLAGRRGDVVKLFSCAHGASFSL